MINRAFDSSSASSDVTASFQSVFQSEKQLLNLSAFTSPVPQVVACGSCSPVFVVYLVHFVKFAFSVHFLIHFRRVHPQACSQPPSIRQRLASLSPRTHGSPNHPCDYPHHIWLSPNIFHFTGLFRPPFRLCQLGTLAVSLISYVYLPLISSLHQLLWHLLLCTFQKDSFLFLPCFPSPFKASITVSLDSTNVSQSSSANLLIFVLAIRSLHSRKRNLNSTWIMLSSSSKLSKHFFLLAE